MRLAAFNLTSFRITLMKTVYLAPREAECVLRDGKPIKADPSSKSWWAQLSGTTPNAGEAETRSKAPRTSTYCLRYLREGKSLKSDAGSAAQKH